MKRLSIIICLILFIIPFFWLKPGEMDLGGDTSRLYFYDPISYLRNQSLYAIVSSGIGGEAISYWAIPHLLLLAFLKSLFQSSTILISFFNGITLSAAFFSIYLIVKELVNTKKTFYEKNILEYASVLAGLFYVFSPYLINGWDRTILTHNQVFLNPLVFYLLLRYFLSSNFVYFSGILLITLFFSPNFTYVGAPGFFAFYPFSFLFLLIYTKYIRKSPIPIKGLCFGVTAFLLLHAFHLVPQLLNLLSSDSGINEAIFSSESKFSRGLSYFSAIAPNIKVSLHLMNLPQLTELKFPSFIFIIFPVIILFGFLWNNLWDKRKTMLLTGIFFLIILFFVSANITDIGLNFYKALFNIPGFSMFRNFYGQWGFVFLFFYAILLGQSLAIVLPKLKRKYSYFLAAFIALFLVITAWPFINGSLYRIDLHQTKHVKPIMQMDPEYEKVLNYVRNLSTDGKILSLPFPDPGYQLIAGKNGGAYIGPSTFSYLAGKNDFSGYEGLLPFSEVFLNAAKDNDLQSIRNIFSILNIRYIFYNSDPNIFDDTFQGFPYGYVRDFLPETQEGYKEFIQNLPLAQRVDFGDKYHLYTIKDDIYLPHIYVTDNLIQANNPKVYLLPPQFTNALLPAVFGLDSPIENPNTIILEAGNNNPFLELQSNSHLHKYEPFISRRLDSIYYPFVLLREQFDRFRVRNKRARYMDLSLLHFTKRILEIVSFGENLPILKAQWKQPQSWRALNTKNYNSWEASLGRYKVQVEQLIRWVSNTTESKSWQEANKIRIAEQLFQHQINLKTYIKSRITNDDDKKYLLSLSQQMFESLFNALNIELSDASNINASLFKVLKDGGEYEVYIQEKKDHAYSFLQDSYIKIQGKKLKPIKIESDSSIVQFDNVFLSNNDSLDFTVHLEPRNLIKDNNWENSGLAKNSTSSVELEIRSISGNSPGNYAKETGLVTAVSQWNPNRQYLITFDYLTFGDDFIFKFYERKFIKGKDSTSVHVFFEKNLNSKNWKTYQSVLTSDVKTIGGYLHFLTDNEKIKSRMLIKNLKVEEVPYPKIIFKKVISAKHYSVPKIVFTKINPTKYKVTINGAKDPYVLVFSEAFNSKWKLFKTDINSTEKIKGEMSRLLGTIGRFALGFFVKDKVKNEEILESYANGAIRETKHRNIFLAPSTFETWGKKPLAENRHFKVNEYANGWNILPLDLGGQEDYELILELSSQKFFYGILGVSLGVFILILGIFIRSMYKKIIL